MDQQPPATPEAPEHPVIAGARAAADVLDKACRADAWQLSDTEVETGLDLVEAANARLAVTRAALIREADTRGLRERTQALSTAAWLADRHCGSRARAQQLVKQAAGLGRHPAVTAALVDAALGTEQAQIAVRVLDRIETIPGLTESDRQAAAELLIEHAAGLDPRGLTAAGQALYEALHAAAASVDDPADEAAVRRDEEAAEAAARRAETNTLRIRPRPDGRTRGSFELSPLGAAALVAWLKHADKRHPGTDGFEDTRPRDERRGDALVDALLTDLAAKGHQPGGGCDEGTDSDESDELADAEVDGFVDATGAFHDGTGSAANLHGVAGALEFPGLDVAHTPPAPPRARIGVTITLEDLRAGLAGAGVLDTGGTLSAAELRRLACDAAIIPIVLGGPAQILDVGRATRSWNPAQERGIYARDRACVAPGCDRPPAACQIHHRWTWADGGPTDVKNGALLCLFHHQQVHRQGWKVTLAANGYPQLIPPASIDPDRRPRQHHRFRLTQLTGRHRT